MIKYNIIKKMFEIDYRYECTKRGREKEYIPESVITNLIYQGVHDLSRRIGIGIESMNLNLKKGISSYVIDADFLRLVSIELQGEVLTPIVKYSYENELISGIGEVKYFSVEELFRSGKIEVNFYPAPIEDTVVKINFMGLTKPYLEESSGNFESNQSTNSATGVIEDDNFEAIEPEFLIAVKLYVLKYFIPEKGADYEVEIERVKYRRKMRGAIKGGLGYRFGI